MQLYSILYHTYRVNSTKSTTYYLITGYTDLRRSIDGLASIIQGQLNLDPFSTFSIYQVLPQLIELWGVNLETQAESKKNLAQLTAR